MIARVLRSANRSVLVVLLVGCAGAPRSPETIVIASGTDLEGMQPLTTVHSLTRQVQRYLVFTPLVRLSATLTPEPWAARSWEWSASHTEVAFVVDTSLRWHDGAAVSAHDARFTLALARDARAGFARRGDLTAIDSVTTSNSDTLRVHFAAPQSELPLVFAELPLLPAHRLRTVAPGSLRSDPFTTAPIGSGPYRVVRREPGRRWILERVTTFPARMGGVASTRTLVIAVVDEATTKVAGLVSGALDIAGVNPATAALVQRDPTLRVLDYPTLFTNWLIFNPRCNVLRDVRVRQAIAKTLDRPRIVAAGVGGYGVPSATPSADWAHDTTRADTAAANALLDAAGWRRSAPGMRVRDGITLTLDMLTVGTGDNPVEQLMQADLRARGIVLRIATRDMGALLASARAQTGAYCAIYTGVAGDPARGQLSALFNPIAVGGALDFGAARPANLRDAFARARMAVDTAQRSAAWRQVLTILTDSMPATAVFHSRGVQGVSRRLQHLTIDLRGELFSAAQWTLTPTTR